MSVLIQGKKVSKTFKLPAEEIHALQEADFEIRKGEFIALMGPSGSGKTTLLDILGCLSRPTSGYLNIMGQNAADADEKTLVRFRREVLGFVFQRSFLIPTLNAKENVLLPLCFREEPRDSKEDEARAIGLLEKVGLKHRLKHFPKQMSGGEMQRVAIARALISKPQIILADEPTGNLDSETGEAVFDLLLGLTSENLAVIFATHNDVLGSRAQRIIRLRDGKII